MQLTILRNQIGPHFLMNTLNNIYALTDLNTFKAKEAIMKLSKLMRYLLYESEHDFVPLHKEFEFLKNYVDLMELRYTHEMDISLILPEGTPEGMIPPDALYLFCGKCIQIWFHVSGKRICAYPV